jgi:hypothetical protein
VAAKGVDDENYYSHMWINFWPALLGATPEQGRPKET